MVEKMVERHSDPPWGGGRPGPAWWRMTAVVGSQRAVGAPLGEARSVWSLLLAEVWGKPALDAQPSHPPPPAYLWLLKRYL